jgi:hypothetical protein
MYHVALVSYKKREIRYAESFKDKPKAEHQYNLLVLQADIDNAGMNPEIEKGGEWGPYIGEEAFKFPVEEKAPAAVEKSKEEKKK